MSDPPAEPERPRPLRRAELAVGLLAAPALTAAALSIAPRLEIGVGAAAAVTFAGGAVIALAPLVVLARAGMAKTMAWAVGLASGLALVAIALTSPRSPWIVVAVNAAIVGGAHVGGSAIGRRVIHPGHLLPACVVAAAADILSVVHPSGPSHAIVRSERALSVLAVHFPVPGTLEAAPALGLGDLVFVALVFGVVTAHRLNISRAALGAALGVALAGALSAALEAAVPALVTIAMCTVAALPEARRLKQSDRRTTAIATVLAAGVVVGVLVQRFFFGAP